MPTHDVSAKLAKLPPVCFTRAPNGRTIMITRGENGYAPVISDLPPEALNAQLTPQPTTDQIEAMLIGSMFGWDVPGADPDVVGARRILDRGAP